MPPMLELRSAAVRSTAGALPARMTSDAATCGRLSPACGTAVPKASRTPLAEDDAFVPGPGRVPPLRFASFHARRSTLDAARRRARCLRARVQYYAL